MENAMKFREKLRRGQVCFAAHISCTDPTITEALCSMADVVWVDMEHNALSLETVQAHFIATKGTDAAVLVRVPWNDPVHIKPILDMGADGVIVPLVRTADDVRRAVAPAATRPKASAASARAAPRASAAWAGPSTAASPTRASSSSSRSSTSTRSTTWTRSWPCPDSPAC
jgi:2-keto-3-deoxy-L-rhamnonate aldolase RhmA